MMSGGHFDYIQYTIDRVADDLGGYIQWAESGELNEYGYKPEYSKATLDKFRECMKTLRLGAAMLQRVDWLVSGDDGEDSFHHRWEEGVVKSNKES
jgi:hypothetical protein